MADRGLWQSVGGPEDRLCPVRPRSDRTELPVRRTVSRRSTQLSSSSFAVIEHGAGRAMERRSRRRPPSVFIRASRVTAARRRPLSTRHPAHRSAAAVAARSQPDTRPIAPPLRRAAAAAAASDPRLRPTAFSGLDGEWDIFWNCPDGTAFTEHCINGGEDATGETVMP